MERTLMDEETPIVIPQNQAHRFSGMDDMTRQYVQELERKQTVAEIEI